MAFKCEKPPQYLVSDKEWDTHRNSGEFDYVVVGSSFCAIGFVHQVLQNTHNRPKIFIIERGDFPEHFHSFTPTELGKEEKSNEEFPWKFSTCEDGYVNRVRGMNYFFGGRSSFWKAWCPKPTEEEMAEWPNEVIKSVHRYFPYAERLLSVKPASKHFNQLQKIIFDKLESIPSKVKTLTRIEHAPLAIVQDQSSEYGRKKYSVLKPLQEILENNINVKAVTGCLVKRIHHEEGRVISLETNKGKFNLGRAKLILAMSTLPSTTLMLNSFPPSYGSIGKRFTAHFASYIYARVPMYDEIITAEKLEMAAVYIAGENKESKHQFHIQLNAVAIREENSRLDIEEMRNLLKAPKECQLEMCKNSIVLICASLGQLDHNNPHNKFYLDHTHTSTDTDITCNATLHCEVNDTDNALWTTMDNTSFEILESLTSTKIEYWNSDKKLWEANRPPTKQIRSRDLVHPASTMWIGRDTESQESPVDLNYKFHGIENVYLTGGALWPTGASWNPTCTMTAMAMDLGDRLSCKQLKKEEHLSNAVDSSNRTERPPNP